MKYEYLQGIKIDGHSLRVYTSNYKGVEFCKQTDARYDTRTGMILQNKKVNVLYFIQGEIEDFKTEEEMLKHIDEVQNGN